jgi:hypothetical protein
MVLYRGYHFDFQATEFGLDRRVGNFHYGHDFHELEIWKISKCRKDNFPQYNVQIVCVGEEKDFGVETLAREKDFNSYVRIVPGSVRALQKGWNKCGRDRCNRDLACVEIWRCAAQTCMC